MKKKITEAELLAGLFGKDLSPRHRAWVEANYQGVVSCATRRVASRCALAPEEIRDLAAAAALCALQSYVAGERPWPMSAADWLNLTTWKAMCLAREQRAKGDKALRAAMRRALPKVVARMHVRNPFRVLNIVKAAYLSDLSVSEICGRFKGLTPKALFRLLFRFRKIFAELQQPLQIDD